MTESAAGNRSRGSLRVSAEERRLARNAALETGTRELYDLIGTSASASAESKEALEAIGWRRGLADWFYFSNWVCVAVLLESHSSDLFLRRLLQGKGHCVDVWSLSSARS